MELKKEYSQLNCTRKKEDISENVDIDFRLLLPQYLDDIERLIKCCVKNTAADYEISSSGIKIFGKSIIGIMYKNSSGNSISNIFEEEFSKTIDLNDGEYADFAEVNVYTAYSSSRLVNQRRIDVHCALNVQVRTYSKKCDNTLLSCENAFVKPSGVKLLNTKAAGVSSCEFDESFTISDAQSGIKNIINTYFNCAVIDKKIIKEKMLVKTNNEISVVYSDENGMLQKSVYSFSLSRIIDISACDENDYALVGAQLTQLYIKPKANSSNKLCDIEAVGRIAISYKISAVEEKSFASDSYIPGYNCECQKSRLTVKQNPIFFNESKSCELEFENEKQIAEIIDLNAQITKSVVMSSNLCFTVVLRYFYYDENSELLYYENEAEYKLKLSDEEYSGEASVTLKSSDFVINSQNRLILRLGIDYSAFIYRENNIEYVNDISIGDKRDNDNASQLTLYFANKGENVWNIAKRFSTDSNLIMQDNDLNNDVIDEKRVILVSGI